MTVRAQTIPAHGAADLVGVRVLAYSAELLHEEGFVGDRALFNNSSAESGSRP